MTTALIALGIFVLVTTLVVSAIVGVRAIHYARCDRVYQVTH